MQELFSDFMNKAKTTDFKKPIGDKFNSARSSIGSMGSKLEQRRQNLKSNVKSKVESGIDGDQVKEEPAAKKKTEDAKNASTDKAASAKEEPAEQ